ncbi:NmrA family NAD(P)-binding protein [Actinorhabdospora filicis]|nr:NmrA family NAD(P)-binding protein [Actinorhabdospora filicis]
MTGHLILVTGATGQQGGAAARALLADGHRVRALVRDTTAPAALALETAGAELAVGDMRDRASLDTAAKGAHGVFSVQPANYFGTLVDEAAMGVNVADAALAAGAEHLVYTSVGAADGAYGRPGAAWFPKALIEQHIADRGLPATVLRPVQFMENHIDPRIGVRSPWPVIRVAGDDQTVQLIAAEDIGRFAARMFADPGRHLGKTYELAGDDLPRPEIVRLLLEAAGEDIDLSSLPKEERAALVPTEPGSFARWSADIPALREILPGLLTFRDWLERTGRAKLQAK